MAEMVIKKWRCDRCRTIFDKRPYVAETCTLEAAIHGEWAGGKVIHWLEMCEPCNQLVEKHIRAIRNEVSEPRNAD